MTFNNVQSTNNQVYTYGYKPTNQGSTRTYNNTDIFTQERQMRGSYESVLPEAPVLQGTPQHERPITLPEDYNEQPTVGLDDVKNASPTNVMPQSVPQEEKPDLITGNASSYTGKKFNPNETYYTPPPGDNGSPINNYGIISQNGAEYVQDAGGNWIRRYSFLKVTW